MYYLNFVCQMSLKTYEIYYIPTGVGSFKLMSVLINFLIFFQESELSFSYNVTEATGLAVGGSWNFEDQTMNSYRTVMFIPTTKWKNVLTEIEKMVD